VRDDREDDTTGGAYVTLYAYTAGPVAQLGARFHGMEEVVSSNLTRSTKFLKQLAFPASQNPVSGVRVESSLLPHQDNGGRGAPN
jgi:hypothetical protein